MSDFHHEISHRIAQVRGDLSSAAEAGDDYLVEVHLGELESLARIAADHDVSIDGVGEALAAYGPASPAQGRLRPAPDACAGA
ncbi:MAG TPA: hypothetical protein VMT69_08980 [Kineosporiaceae bacterium]|nr:hypothetical protein [Kineosporiaceae bacterium]